MQNGSYDSFDNEYSFEHNERKGRWRHTYDSGATKYERTLDGDIDICVEYYENGHIKKTTRFFEKAEDGIWRFYYEDGSVKAQQSYEKGRAHGEWLQFHENGAKKSSTLYAHGLMDGETVSWNENGSIASTGFFSGDRKEGSWSFFDTNGKLSQRRLFVRGKEDGLFEEFFANGAVKRVGNFKAGLKDGVWTEYDENGRILSEECFKNGERNGAAICFECDRDVKMERTFANGILIEQKEFLSKDRVFVAKFYEDGTLKAEGDMIFSDGGWLLEDMWREYDDEGYLLMEKNYCYGELDGVSVSFFKNGKCSSLLSYKNGVVDGVVRRFLSDGTLGYEGIYKNGIEIERKKLSDAHFLQLPNLDSDWFLRLLPHLPLFGRFLARKTQADLFSAP